MDTLPGGRELRDLWEIIVRRRWVIWLSVTLCSTAALIGSFLVLPMYRATATLQIERQNPDILTFQNLSQMDYSWVAYSDFYQTQYKILASEGVARRAVQRLDLTANPEFQPEGRAEEPGLLSKLKAVIPRKARASNLTPEDRATLRVLGGLQIEPVRNSQLVKVAWASADPHLAADVANAVVEAYIQSNIESSFTTSDQAEDFLVNQVGSLKREIGAIEDRLQEYGEAKSIVSIDDSQNITMKALQDIGQRLTQAQTELAQAEARYRAIRDTPAEGLPEVLDSPLIGRLRAEHALYEAEHSEAAQRFKDGWPGLKTLHSKVEQVNERLQTETRRIADQVLAAAEADRERAGKAVANFRELLESQTQAAQRLKRDSVEFANLQGEVNKKRETLDKLMQRQNEIALSTRLRDLETTSTNIRVMERARPPAGPFRPNTRFNLLVGLVSGLGLGFVLAFVLDYLDNTINSPAEAERILGLPVLALVPRHRGSPSRLARSRRKAETVPSVDLVSHHDPRSPVAEAYRELRTSILLSHAGEPPRRIMVTSAIPEEGKSATAINLAAVLAQLGRRVLLIDTDLRRPRLHRAMELRNDRGVSTYLSGMESDPMSLVRASKVEGLDMMSSGPIPPNPSELLNSSMFTRMTNELLAAGYDHLLFDSPPVLSVSDPIVIASTVDVGILVVRAAHSPRQSVKLAADKLKQAGATPSGLVLNDVDVDSRGGAYYSYHYVGDYDAADDGASDSKKAKMSSSA